MPPKKGQTSAKSKSTTSSIPEGSEHIVFGDDNKKGKKQGTKAKDTQPAEESGPPKPTVKQIIGGASWTGKLPVNLLSEHCQRLKWNKPDYSMRQSANPANQDEKLYRSEVTLSRTDPKTRDMVTIPTFRTPSQLVEASQEASALEARHFAATYALFRISSMKNLSMALPPKYRDLWKQLQILKKEDEKEGRGWQYDADPFAAQQKRQEIHAAMDKRKGEQEKKQEALAKNPALALQHMPRSKQWENAPKIEMGAKIRSEIERLVRNSSIWNPFHLKFLDDDRRKVQAKLTNLGFRSAHIKEAMEYCSDENEVLEWLLVHVPEDDLPGFALPSNYAAGVSLASGDLSFESKLQRLALAGYPRDLVSQALRSCSENEHQAAFFLQNSLWKTNEGVLNDDIDSQLEWNGEKAALEAIYADRFQSSGDLDICITLQVGTVSGVRIRFIVPTVGYPYELPAVSINSPSLPAYIRLSATKQAIQFAETNFKGSAMIYDICDWLEANFQSIIDHPMPLTELRASEIAVQSPDTSMSEQPQKRHLVHRQKRSSNSSKIAQDLKSVWEIKQRTAGQQSMIRVRQNLPAWQKQKQILSSIELDQFSVITGETGSGKSTQVVQFVLDEAIDNLEGDKINILCTQPRRVAALSLADRVSAERCSQVADEVGYMIRGDTKVSPSTKITFMTTGVLLRRLQTSASMTEALRDISHIFIDEVHERSLDTDFLLALLKNAARHGSTTKVILMSATVDKEVFIDYFGGSDQVSHVHIEGRTHPVTDLYLEDVLTRTNFASELGGDATTPMSKVIQNMGSRINYDLISTLVKHIDQELGSAPGAILIFLPGTFEIDRTLRAVSTLPHVVAYPLHASLLPAEQRKVFPPAQNGTRKVIAATNVAETSITIEDVVAVIDTGKVKETRFDNADNVVRLEEVWASQAACKQRRGRAGRVHEGTCYKLFTRSIEDKMAPKPLPEIRRVPLEQLCLSVKAAQSDIRVEDFLAALITPPDASAVTNALISLHAMGALEVERLTALGTYMAMIPIDLRCAKLLVFGVLFDCLEPCLTIASILSLRSPFMSPREKREEADAARATFSNARGDVLLNLAAYEEYWQQSKSLRYRQIQAWCNDKFLSLTTLKDITSTRSQLLDALKDANLVPANYRSLDTPFNGSQQILTAVIAAALQPQIAEIRLPERKYIQSLTGAKELDPEAKAIRYFIPVAGMDSDSLTSTPSESAQITPNNSRSATPQPVCSSLTAVGKVAAVDPVKSWQRVFIHPSSPLFHSTPASLTSGSGAASYLSYFSKMATGGGPMGAKIYIHSLTPLNTYTQSLFGSGGVKIDTTIPGGGLLIGDSFKVRGWARIGVLVGRLRRLLDEELRKAIDQPAASRNFANNDLIKVVKWLIELNGQDR